VSLSVFGLAALLTVLAIELALRAMERGEHAVVRHGWGLAVMLGVLGVNVGISLWQGHWANGSWMGVGSYPSYMLT
jgi:hypothetical protein